MDKRTEYWNNTYVEYWKEKVAETAESGESSITKGDVKTVGDDALYKEFDKFSYNTGDKLLDYGCGFGRFYDYFKKKKQDYYGIDISQGMITEALKNYPELEGKVSVSEGEHLKFDENTFDKVICYGVFDCCYQNEALSEMLRVTKRGGIYI